MVLVVLLLLMEIQVKVDQVVVQVLERMALGLKRLVNLVVDQEQYSYQLRAITSSCMPNQPLPMVRVTQPNTTTTTTIHHITTI